MGPVGKGSGEEPLTAPERDGSNQMHNDGDSVKHTAVARARRIRSAKKNRATLVAAAYSVPGEEEPGQANGPPPSEDGDPDDGGGSEELPSDEAVGGAVQAEGASEEGEHAVVHLLDLVRRGEALEAAVLREAAHGGRHCAAGAGCFGASAASEGAPRCWRCCKLL